jgi:hypothetical protein
MHHIWFHSESEDQSRETSLMPEYMLPSKLGTKRIRAVKVDILDYKNEMEKYSNFDDTKINLSKSQKELLDDI